MTHAAQEALCSPEFCSTLGRRKTPFCLFSSRKQQADKVWLVRDGILPQASLQPSQRHVLDITGPPDDFRRTLDPFSGNAISLIQDCVLSLNHSVPPSACWAHWEERALYRESHWVCIGAQLRPGGKRGESWSHSLEMSRMCLTET